LPWNTLSYAKKPKNEIDRINIISRLDKGSVSPSFQASSENEIGTAKAKAPIVTWLASSKLKLKFIIFPND
jgi:hypothetical protein